MTALFSSLVALSILLAVALLLRPASAAGDDAMAEQRREDQRGLWEGSGLAFAERILDPADYRWLRYELGFPILAESLRAHRQQLALRWLKAIRSSFGELVRTPESAMPGVAHDPQSSWQLLRLTLQFHFLLSYAVFVVRFFGPYHRLIPSLSWIRLPWKTLPGAEPHTATDAKRSF